MPIALMSCVMWILNETCTKESRIMVKLQIYDADDDASIFKKN